MVRISSTLLPTNTSGIPQQEITNASIAITSSGTLNVSDSTAQTSLSNIESSVSGTLLVEDTTAQGTLSNIENSLTATLVVEDITAQSSLADIVTAVQGTLSVSASVAIAGSRSNLSNAASVLSGDNSTAVDVSGYSKNTVYIDSTTADRIDLFWSPDGSNWYYRQSIIPEFAGSAYYATANFDNAVVHSMRLLYTATGVVTAGIISRI